MRIFTYFDCTPGLPHQGEIIRQWRDSWERRGWDCRILNPRTYAGHSLWPDFRRAIRFMGPSQRARLSRWLALYAIGGGFICHYDVINFGPDGYFPVVPKTTGSVIFSDDFSYAYVNRKACGEVVRNIISGHETEATAFCDVSQIDPYQKHHTLYGDPGWDRSHTVHFGTHGIKLHLDDQILPKHKIIESCGRSF